MSLSPAELALLLRSTPFVPSPESLWRPPLDWRFVADRMRPDLREVFIARCEAWHKAHPRPPPPPPPPLKPENKVDINLFNLAFKKYGAVIPIPELFKIGYSKEQVAKVVDKRKWYAKNDAALQKEIDRRWPGGKTKKKVIKAVNKRLPVVNRNVRKED